MNLGVDVQRRGQWVVLTPLGDLDMASAPRLRQEVITAVAGGMTHIVIDMGSVEFVDSVGLGVMVGALRRTRSHGGDAVVARVNPSVGAVLELVGLDRVFTVHEAVDAAVEPQP